MPKTAVLQTTHNDVFALLQKVSDEETQPLSFSMLSKKHVRILVALFSLRIVACEKNSISATVHAIRGIIADMTYKLYPMLDIEVFTYDLAMRGYLVTHKDTNKESFSLSDQGELLLQAIAIHHSELLHESTSPNFSPRLSNHSKH
jgi:hypothetical protein